MLQAIVLLLATGVPLGAGLSCIADDSGRAQRRGVAVKQLQKLGYTVKSDGTMTFKPVSLYRINKNLNWQIPPVTQANSSIPDVSPLLRNLLRAKPFFSLWQIRFRLGCCVSCTRRSVYRTALSF